MDTFVPEFTEADYRQLLRLARAQYAFCRFPEHAHVERGVLWRHDVDISPQRALALARIEHAEGVVATYFIHLHSIFYNALEPQVVECFRGIAALGHAFGLHFEPQFYKGMTPSAPAAVDVAIRAEATALESIISCRSEAVSYHNPDAMWSALDTDELGGLVNTYGRSVRARFQYCSDSNGHWRHQPLRALLVSGAPRLHVLTHPEWWTPDAMPSREKIARATEGHSASVIRSYEAQLEATGRTDEWFRGDK